MGDSLLAKMGNEILCCEAEDSSKIEKVIDIGGFEGPWKVSKRDMKQDGRLKEKETYGPS